MLNLETALMTIKERSVRQFYLINDIGELFDLTSQLEDPNELFSAFMNNPAGIGFEFEDTYSELYYYNILTERKWTNSNYTGELVFRSYAQHSSFEYFVAQTSKLYLAYISPFESSNNSQTLKTYAECSLVSAPNNEIKFEDSLLRIPVVFHLLEPMKTGKTLKTGISIDESVNTKTYPYAYNTGANSDSYIYGDKSGSFVTINNFGTAPTFPKIIISGPSTSPSISVKNCNTGEVLQVVAIDFPLTEGGEIILNNDPLDQYLLVNGLNGYDYINKDLDVYLVIPPGKHIIQMEAEQGSMEVEYELKFY